MKISAVICELNPFHDGHKYILGEAKNESEVVIAVMSGNYVQRGECSVYHKYKRAKDAVENGADLCLELPFPFSSSSAEYFARAGVCIAENIGATDLYFGSECADMNSLSKAADVLLDNKIKSGRAAKERENILINKIPNIPESILSSPNDILAVEYCKHAQINLHPVKRITAESAADIRKKLYITDENAVKASYLTRLEFEFFKALREAPKTAECAGGVGGRLLNAAALTNSYEEWLEKAATKQYTNGRLKRAALFSLLGITQSEMKELPAFTRVLAANEKGRDYLSAIRYTVDFPIITNVSDRFNLKGTALRQYNTSDFADKYYTFLSKMSDCAFFAKSHPEML